MKNAFTTSGEKVQVLENTRDLGHGEQVNVIYSDGSEGWEHIEDIEMVEQEKTYDIQFDDCENSNRKGFQVSLEEAKNYIQQYNGTNESYFADYKGGMVQVVENESGEVAYEEEIK
jgi:hypothetical protein